MSTSVLPQLMAVDSELSEQAIALEAQLTELQAKRQGIQTVISMFESGVAPDAADLSAVTEVSKKAPEKKTAKTETKRQTKTAAKAPAKKATPAKKAAKPAKVKAKRGRPAKAKSPAKSSTSSVTAAKEKKTTKRSGRTANWQRYVQDSYRKANLPDVIVGVLQAQPTNVFKIADVMNVVFKEDMPKNHFLKARNRISNILSAGARDGVWYRGRGGTYSMSEKAIKAS